MHEDPQAITYLGETNFRNRNTKFGIKTVDRSRHMYIIGKSGTGKSTFLETMAIQDIERGNGLVFMDPHGGSASKLLEYIPDWRKEDVIYFAPFDMDFPLSFNVMEDVGKDRRHLVSNGLMSAFKKIWVDAWSARMEYILNNILLALLEYPDASLLGVNRMLSDKDYRKLVVANVTDPSVKAFWVDEFAKYSDRYMQEAGAAIQNKIGQFVTNPLIRNIIGQTRSSFDFRTAMDTKKIVVVNLSKGQMGDQNASLLGAMLITKIYLSAMSRADLPSHVMATMPSFYFYADEFQNFANESFADILSEARKYKLCLTIAHQYVDQLPETLRSAVFGNVGSMVVFRVGAQDAEIFEKEFAPVFKQDDFTNLGFRHMYLRISIDGVGSKPFSAMTLAMSPNTSEGSLRHQEIVELSRKKYAHPRADVEEAIQSWYGTTSSNSVLNEAGFSNAKAQVLVAQGIPLEPPEFADQAKKQPLQQHPERSNQGGVNRQTVSVPPPSERPIAGFRPPDTRNAKTQQNRPVFSERPNTVPPAPVPPRMPLKGPLPDKSEQLKDMSPIKVSSDLAQLINAIDASDTTSVVPDQTQQEQSQTPQQMKNAMPMRPASVQQQTEPPRRPAIKANLRPPQRPLPAKTITSFHDRSAGEDKKQSLKDILAKALSSTKLAPSVSTPTPPVTPKPSQQSDNALPSNEPKKFMSLRDLPPVQSPFNGGDEDVAAPESHQAPSHTPRMLGVQKSATPMQSDSQEQQKQPERKERAVYVPRMLGVQKPAVQPEQKSEQNVIEEYVPPTAYEEPAPRKPNHSLEQKPQPQPQPQPIYRSPVPKEVPEDVLRRVLE